ncbi:MAG: MBL fold metallo-hydrolase [Myxococcota bacterium]
MKRILSGFGLVVLVVLALLFAFRTTLVRGLLDRIVATNMQGSLLDDLPDGLHVVLCGAGSPLADPKRSGPCTAVVAGGRLFVVDAGSGASRVMSRMRLPQGEIDAILLTHFHSDHIDGLGELLLQRWANSGATTPVPLHGPEGVGEVVEGLDRAYRQSRAYRVAHHGEAVVPSGGAGATALPFRAPRDGEEVVVVDDAGLRVVAFRVDHAPVEPAVGYRFDYGGRSVLLSGDTTKSANLQRFAGDVDLLVHEALSRDLVSVLGRGARAAGRERLAKIIDDIQDYHASPVEAAEVARDAGVGHLLFNHIVPPLPIAPLEDLFLEGVSDVYQGPVTLGRDGTLVILEAGGAEVEVRELL